MVNLAIGLKEQKLVKLESQARSDYENLTRQWWKPITSGETISGEVLSFNEDFLIGEGGTKTPSMAIRKNSGEVVLICDKELLLIKGDVYVVCNGDLVAIRFNGLIGERPPVIGKYSLFIERNNP